MTKKRIYRQTRLDPTFFTDPQVANEISKISAYVSKINHHNMLTPDDYKEMLDIADDAIDELRELIAKLENTYFCMIGGI